MLVVSTKTTSTIKIKQTTLIHVNPLPPLAEKIQTMLLENDAFLSELTKLFQKSKTSGSVVLTMKRWDGHNKPKPRTGHLPEPTEYKCLIRASVGNKKLSTVVNQKDVNKFQMAYANLLKGNMDGLKKKDKKSAGKSKSKATQ